MRRGEGNGKGWMGAKREGGIRRNEGLSFYL